MDAVTHKGKAHTIVVVSLRLTIGVGGVANRQALSWKMGHVVHIVVTENSNSYGMLYMCTS